MSPIDRRQFLQTAGAAAAGLAAQSDVRATSLEKSESASQARLFVGCCAISYSRSFRSGQLTMEDFIAKAVELRVDGVDMTVYFLKSTEPGYLANLRHLASKNGIAFSGAACGSNMVEADAAKRIQALEDIKKWIEATDRLGASHLRVFAGKLPAGATTDQAVGWSVEVMKAACDYAGRRGITLGIENHLGISQHADTLLEIIRRVDSPYAGINLDITHFIPTPATDGYAQIEACIPYATHTHIRHKFDSGELIDLDRVWQLFAKGGYKGYMSIEYENENEEPSTGVPKLVGELRKLCTKYSTV